MPSDHLHHLEYARGPNPLGFFADEFVGQGKTLNSEEVRIKIASYLPWGRQASMPRPKFRLCGEPRSHGAISARLRWVAHGRRPGCVQGAAQGLMFLCSDCVLAPEYPDRVWDTYQEARMMAGDEVDVHSEGKLMVGIDDTTKRVNRSIELP